MLRTVLPLFLLLSGSGSTVSPLALGTPFGAVGDGWIAASYDNINANDQDYIETGVVTPTMEYALNPFIQGFTANAAFDGADLTEIASQVPTVLAAMPGTGVVIVEGGLISDFGADVVPALTTMVRQFQAAGHRVILLEIPPSDPGNPFSPQIEAARQSINASLALLASSTVLCFNGDNLGLQASDYSDQIHLTPDGFNKYGAALAQYIAPWVPSADTRTVATPNYLLNPTLTGGNPPTNWTIDTNSADAGGATVTSSIVNGKWRVSISGTYSGNNISVSATQTQGAPFPTAGSLVEGVMSYTVVGPVQNVYLPNFVVSVSGVALGSSSFPQLVTSRTSGRFVAKTPPIQVAAGSPGFNQGYANIVFYNAASPAPISGTFDFDFMTIRKVGYNN